jgi:hypothetical protein
MRFWSGQQCDDGGDLSDLQLAAAGLLYSLPGPPVDGRCRVACDEAERVLHASGRGVRDVLRLAA